MSLIAFGVNHHSASIDIREKLSFTPSDVPIAMRHIQDSSLAEEVVIFSTCNRTELYLANAEKPNSLYQWLADFHDIELPVVRAHTYLYQNEHASKHLFRVATGLDSIALGEPQILGQIKEAYHTSVASKATKQTLNRLFQEAFYVAKNVRSTTKLGENSISIAYAAVKLADHFFSDYSELTALIIGAGQTSELAAKTLHKKGLGKLIIANRTLSKAQDLALELGGYATTLEQVSDHIDEADIIISATNKIDFTVTKNMVESTQGARKNKMQLFLDLAVPRDIDPAIKKLNNSYLYAVDDLKGIIEKNKVLRMQAAEQAEQMIEVHNKNFTSWLQLRQHHNLIRNLYEHAQNEKEKLTEQALKQIRNGSDVEAVLASFATKLTKKLTHQPSVLVRRASEKGNAELLDEIKSIYNFD